MLKTVTNLIVLVCVSMQLLNCASSCRISNEQIDKLASASDFAKPSVEFTGRYRMVTTSCFDEFLKELGVGFFKRNIASRMKPDYEITKNGDEYTLKTLSSVSSSQIVFKLNGEQFHESRMDGVDVQAAMTQSGNKWIHRQFGDKQVIIVREFTGNSITVTAIVNNVASVRVYNRY